MKRKTTLCLLYKSTLNVVGEVRMREEKTFGERHGMSLLGYLNSLRFSKGPFTSS